MVDIRNILCPIDFSDFSRHALDHAVALAKWYESTVTVLHVCAAAPVVAYAPGTPMLPSAAFTREDRTTLVASMRQFAEAEGGLNVPSGLNSPRVAPPTRSWPGLTGRRPI